MKTRKKGKAAGQTARERRVIAEACRKQRDELVESTLLGMDDGTEEAALNEELDFGKFLDVIDAEEAAYDERMREAQGDRPVLEEQKRFRERVGGAKTYWR